MQRDAHSQWLPLFAAAVPVRGAARSPAFGLRRIRGWFSLIVAGLLLAGVAPSAKAAAIYWTNSGQGTFGRADLDGTNVNPSFITGSDFPNAIAVGGAFIYWNNRFSIGHASLDGTGVNQNFIAGTVSTESYGLAVDENYIYWSLSTNSIGRANLDGTGVDLNFITADHPHGMAVDGTSIYWVNGFEIARANLDGTNVNPNFITGPAVGQPFAIAVSGTFIYWSDLRFNSIGRANLDGTNVNPNFITGVPMPWGLAVGGGFVYWGNGFSSIGRASLDGTGVNQNFIVGVISFGLAVATVPEPDADGDGIPDALDKCTLDSRNVVLSCDTDQDGYGNPCDADFDQSSAVTSVDFAMFFVPAFASGAPSSPGQDMDCNASVNANDFVNYFVPKFRGALGGAVPGPSGLPCAGTPGCM